MWTKIPECRKNPYCPLMEKREEHLVYLIFDYHGGGDKLPMECGRFMTVGMAVQILSCEMKTAKALGKKKLLVIIKGGDPFRRLEDLKSLCSQVWKEAEKTKIQVCIEVKTSSEHISPEAFQWYQKNADKVSLWFRCSGFDKGIAEILKKTGCGLLYEMDVTKTGEVISNLFEWHSREIPIQLEMKTPIEDWSRETLENYEKICDGLRAYLPELIAFPWSGETLRLLKGKVGSSGETSDGCCYDTNGWQWFCPALSPLKLFSWEMDEENLQEIWQKEPLAALRWICPGELLEWGEKKDFLTQKKMQEHLLGMQGLKNAGGTQMKTMLKELCLEAKEEKTI